MYAGKLVRLREPRKNDLEKTRAFLNDCETRDYMNPGIAYPYTAADAEKWFEKISANHDTYHFAIETLDTGKYIGGCGINAVNWKIRAAELEIFIGDKDYRGKGYGTDAMEVLIDFCFSEMNLNKIILMVHSFNERALRCYEKCGFNVEGVLRREVFRHGRYYDRIAMGLLREEWEACSRGSEEV